MKKGSLFLAGFFLFLSTTILPYDPSGYLGKAMEKGQPERPKFYAIQVIFERNVLNANDSLGEPDNYSAEILPAGQLVVLMENKLYPFPILLEEEDYAGLLDSGSVIGQGETDFSLEGWFSVQDEQGRQDYVWKSLGISLTGFYIWLEGSAGVDMIRIANLGRKSLFVDAIIGYSIEAEGR